MKLIRICLLLIMAMLVLLMISLPGSQDSRRMAKAWAHYRDTPNDSTRKELEDARAADRKQMIKIELALGAILAIPTVLFVKLSK
jgi:hypothetical protein